MIHRDNRKFYEASSALNQIIHREGPNELTVGDIDTYAAKWRGDVTTLRLIEHKQPDQPLGKAQAIALNTFDAVIRHVVQQSPDGLKLDGSSGVFLMRGQLTASDHGRKKVDFAGPQIIDGLDGTRILTPTNRGELWDWLNGGKDWTPRNNRARYWR